MVHHLRALPVLLHPMVAEAAVTKRIRTRKTAGYLWVDRPILLLHHRHPMSPEGGHESRTKSKRRRKSIFHLSPLRRIFPNGKTQCGGKCTEHLADETTKPLAGLTRHSMFRRTPVLTQSWNLFPIRSGGDSEHFPPNALKHSSERKRANWGDDYNARSPSTMTQVVAYPFAISGE